MRNKISGKIQSSNRRPGIASGTTGVHWFLPLAIVTAVWTGFVPILRNDFVEWDDYENLISNQNFRGLGWSQLSWMFTTFHMGHYKPLSWLTLGIDYSIWGMDPVGYHITNVVLHSANTVGFYFVTRQLLALTQSDSDAAASWPISLSAAFAALYFGLHPLRVESVAWATERRDVLSGFFYLGAIYCYLRAFSRSDGNAPARRWMAAALILYPLSLLSKATAITFPMVLILLDIYPLRRLTWNIRQWFAPQSRKVWREKIPFVAIAAVFALVAISGLRDAAVIKSLGSYGIEQRLAQTFFGSIFYFWKTLWPVGLSPLYEIPPNFGLWNSAVLSAGAATLAISVALFSIRHRWPAALVCWLYYLTVLFPLLGLVANGPQLVADRYSYLSCMGWAVLAGGALLWFVRGAQRTPSGVPTAGIGATAIAILVGLACLTWRQTAIWRNTETLWTRVVSIDPNSSTGHYNLGRELARQGMHQTAIEHYRLALRIRPNDPDAHNNLGLLLAVTGEFDAGLAELRRAIEIDPSYDKGYYNLGRVLFRRGDLIGAEMNLRKASQLNPREADIRIALGAVLQRQRQWAEAGDHFKEAVRLRPDSPDAHTALARWLASQHEAREASNHYREALRLLKAGRQQDSARDGLDRTPEYAH